MSGMRDIIIKPSDETSEIQKWFWTMENKFAEIFEKHLTKRHDSDIILKLPSERPAPTTKSFLKKL